jgi:hypothetical protein
LHEGWKTFIGTYAIQYKNGFELSWYANLARVFGIALPKIKIYGEGRRLWLNYYDGDRYTGAKFLTEVRPGLFFTSSGESVDFRDGVRFRNIECR